MSSNYDTIYKEYWAHARHIEKELWSLTSIYSAIITGIFAAVGVNLPHGIILGISFFGFILSILGFFLVFTLRLSFVRFVCLAEVIAINKLELEAPYRRFYQTGHTRLMSDKPITEPDILTAFYSLLAAILLGLSLNLAFGESVINYITAGIVLVTMFLTHWTVFREKYEIIWQNIGKSIEK